MLVTVTVPFDWIGYENVRAMNREGHKKRRPATSECFCPLSLRAIDQSTLGAPFTDPLIF
jgi:hypothetical protein